MDQLRKGTIDANGQLAALSAGLKRSAGLDEEDCMRGRLGAVVVCVALGFGCGRLKPTGSNADGAADAPRPDATDTTNAARDADVAEVGDADATDDMGVDGAADTLLDASGDTDAEAGAAGSGGTHTTTDGLNGF